MPGQKSRYFGNVRKLPSGRYQARYRGPDGRMLTAAHTFARKADASRWLTFKEAEVRSGDWIDPDAARVTFGDYTEQWIGDRVLKVRTEELYRGLLRNHLLPFFGNVSMGDIDEAAIRRWRKERLRAGPTASRPFGPVVVAKAYRLLHAIFTTAADDRLVRRNPCRIEGGGQELSPERETLSLPEVFGIAGAIPVRYRVLVLLATFAGLRWGELIALRRHNIDLEACEIRIVETTAQLDTGRLQAETPKSRAGRRAVASQPNSCPRSAGIWSGSPSRGSGAYSSSALTVRGSDAPTLDGSGSRPALKPVRLACTSTICDTRAAPSPPPPAPALRN
jgi:hypothetical protein